MCATIWFSLDPLSYFPQWTVEDVDQGYHWSMFDMQGKDNIWFTGGGLSWDSVKSCMEYNNLLLRQAGITPATESD